MHRSINCSRNQTAELSARSVTLLPQCKDSVFRRWQAARRRNTNTHSRQRWRIKAAKALLISLYLLPSLQHFFLVSAGLLNVSACANIYCAASLWCINAHLRQSLICNSALRRGEARPGLAGPEQPNHHAVVSSNAETVATFSATPAWWVVTV